MSNNGDGFNNFLKISGTTLDKLTPRKKSKSEVKTLHL